MGHPRHRAGAEYGNETGKKQYEQEVQASCQPQIIREYLVETRVRGERGKQFYHVWRYWLDPHTGSKRAERELITDTRRLAKLRTEMDVEPEMLVEVKTSPMNDLLAGLSWAILTANDGCPANLDAKDWPFNLRLANLRVNHLREKSKKALSYAEIVEAIIPLRRIEGRLTQVLCKFCHTPLLFRFILNGTRVTRRNNFATRYAK